MDRLRYISVHNYEYILGSLCTSYLQQHKLVLTCVAWGADRKDAVLHNGVVSVNCNINTATPAVRVIMDYIFIKN